jgi:hypothetical protein
MPTRQGAAVDPAVLIIADAEWPHSLITEPHSPRNEDRLLHRLPEQSNSPADLGKIDLKPAR